MTKSESKEITKAIRYSEAGLGADYLARALSGLYRAARTTQSKLEIMAIATEYSITDNPEFIV
jgi:hypothetical protein